MRWLWQMLRRVLGALARLPLFAAIARIFGRMVEAGTRGYREDVKRRLMILNAFSFLIILTTVIFAIQYSLTAGAEYRPLVLINLSIAAIVSLVPLMHRINEIAGGLLIVVTEYLAITNIAPYLGRDGGGHLLFIVGAAAPFFVFGLERLKLVIAIVVGGGVDPTRRPTHWGGRRSALIPSRYVRRDGDVCPRLVRAGVHAAPGASQRVASR